MYIITYQGFIKKKGLIHFHSWLLVVFQISCSFSFSFLGLYQWVHTETLKVKNENL